MYGELILPSGPIGVFLSTSDELWRKLTDLPAMMNPIDMLIIKTCCIKTKSINIGLKLWWYQ